jgi:hypothetical protein
MTMPSSPRVNRHEVPGVDAEPVSAGLHYQHALFDRPDECLITGMLCTPHTEITVLIPDLDATVTTVGYLPGPLPAATVIGFRDRHQQPLLQS